MLHSAGPSVSLPISSNVDVPSTAEQPAVLFMASFQSVISSMARNALYSHLAQLGLPAIAASSSQAANPVTMSNSTQFSSTSLITDLQRPSMSNLFGSVTLAPSFVGTNTQFSVVNSTLLVSASVSYALSNVASVPQGRMGYAGTHVPMSVPRLGLIKPGQTYVCPKLCAFSIKITLWLILPIFENRRLVCPKLRAFSELFVSSCCQ